MKLKDHATGEEKQLPCEGVFLFIGQAPNSDFLQGTLELDDDGFVKADPNTLETSKEGVFAVGDLRSGSSKQITAAVGEGTVASFMVKKCLEEKRRG